MPKVTRRQFTLGLCAGAGAVAARRVTADAPSLRINLGTLAPRGSTYFQTLQAMGEQWRAQGARLVIYPDGTQGSEADMVRLMRVGTLQAGLLTATGLAEIDPAVTALQSYPLLFRDFDEFGYVLQHLQPRLTSRLEAQGFVPLFWGDAGWLRYFFKERVATLAQLHQTKVFVWSVATEQQRIMRDMGWKPVPLETADIMQGLATGQITGVSVPPIVALVGQFEKHVPFMVDLNYAPLVGACVIRKDLWGKLSDAQRDAMLRIAQAAGGDVVQRTRLESVQAVAKMQSQGLTVYSLSGEQRAAWQAEADIFQARARGRIVPAELHDGIFQLLAEYRSGKNA
ncbi:MAG: TRAP transporter substrate-binding protein DctP [Steroidobacterales bacterium]